VKKISIPDERWQSQQRAAWAKLARSEAPNKQVDELAQEMITRREWLFQQEYPDRSPVQKAVRDLAAKLEVTPADSGTADSLNAQEEHHDEDKIPAACKRRASNGSREQPTNS
jgi:predicted outer membrane protein